MFKTAISILLSMIFVGGVCNYQLDITKTLFYGF